MYKFMDLLTSRGLWVCRRSRGEIKLSMLLIWATIRSAICGITGCLLLLLGGRKAWARQQEETLPQAMENNLENETAGTEAVPEDDAQWQTLNALARHKIQLNTADEATLQSIGLLTPLQISRFLRYRALLGDLLSIYELQAVPGFEPDVIRRILPYVTVGDDLAPHYTLRDYAQKRVITRSCCVMPVRQRKQRGICTLIVPFTCLQRKPRKSVYALPL